MKSLYLLTILFVLISCTHSVETNEQDKTIENPILANDLSNKQINAIMEDANGHIWIGTFRGLNKYNGREYHQYFCNGDSTGLPDNQIKDLLKDSKGRLWVATVNGIVRYTHQDKFAPVPVEYSNKNCIQLIESKDGRIFANMTSEICEYNSQKERFEPIIKNLDPHHSYLFQCHIDLNNNLWTNDSETLMCYRLSTMQCIDSLHLSNSPSYSYLQKNGDLWLSGNHTTLVFDTRHHKLKTLPEVILKHPILSKATIEHIHPYHENGLLFITARQGIFYYDFINQKVLAQGETGFPFEVPRFKIKTMYTDSQKNLWIGSVDQGIVVKYNNKERFNNNSYLQSFMKNRSVIALASDKQGLWISTLLDGLFRYDLQNKRITAIDLSSIGSKEDNPEVNYIYIDDEDKIWMIVDNYKTVRCSYNDGHLNVEKSYPIPYGRFITQDANKTMWVCTSNKLIYGMKKGDSEFKPISISSQQYTFIPCALPMNDGNLLVAAFYQPLIKIDTHTYTIDRLDFPMDQIKKCLPRSVFIPTVLFGDSYGMIWIGTITNGLLLYNPKEKSIQPVGGTSCTDICSIEEDTQGNIWISTLYGLCKYDRTIARFTNYYTADGIGGNQFYERASCLMQDGTLVFGGTHGLTFFNPIDVKTKRNIPLLFEDLKINNRLVHPQAPDISCIDKHLSLKPDIHLKHDQNNFSISFSALDYSEYDRVHYYYKLEGLNNFWIDANNNREAYYANVPAGNYIFKVKITNNDKSIIEAENSIRVIVSPAPWNSWWAYCIYLILGLVILYFIINSWQRVQAEKAAAHQLEMEKLQEQRTNKMNMSFFANISHEFRTPLTMIYGPITQLCTSNEITGENKNLLCIIQRSVDRMLKLVNQLMDFNKLENDTLKLQVKRTDIIATLQRLTDIFKVNASNKGITLTTYGLEDSFLLWLDEDKVDKIFGNLMSNALKYTPIGGRIRVCFDVIMRDDAAKLFTLTTDNKDSQYIKITVTNSGNNIPEDKREKIFDRYYQLSNQNEVFNNWGTGIGLYYAKSLTLLHHGQIKAMQPEDEDGASFVFILPVNDLSYSEEERTEKPKDQISSYPLHNLYQSQNESIEKAQKEEKSILIVDDDTEVAFYLKTLLSPHYHVTSRFDVENALKYVKESAPDLILSDVIMPGRNGYEFCNEIKQDRFLCHIPVILVTAKSTLDDQIEGLKTGADAYITKPFEPSYLLALIQSQLKNRENTQNLLTQSTQTDKIEEDVLSPQDKEFMTELYRLMENELSNPELDIARMTEIMKISRTKLYYKIKGLTGENPSVFFKTYKLNRAAKLIVEGKYTVSEISDITGFSTLSHFSKSFKKQFGVAPSDYRGTPNNG